VRDCGQSGGEHSHHGKKQQHPQSGQEKAPTSPFAFCILQPAHNGSGPVLGFVCSEFRVFQFGRRAFFSLVEMKRSYVPRVGGAQGVKVPGGSAAKQGDLQ
jgi:hypothetical protein